MHRERRRARRRGRGPRRGHRRAAAASTSPVAGPVPPSGPDAGAPGGASRCRSAAWTARRGGGPSPPSVRSRRPRRPIHQRPAGRSLATRAVRRAPAPPPTPRRVCAPLPPTRGALGGSSGSSTTTGRERSVCRSPARSERPCNGRRVRTEAASEGIAERVRRVGRHHQGARTSVSGMQCGRSRHGGLAGATFARHEQDASGAMTTAARRSWVEQFGVHGATREVVAGRGRAQHRGRNHQRVCPSAAPSCRLVL